MDIAQLEVFVDIMRRGSFAAVARNRGVDPATISRSLAALEDSLKLRLFQRTTRKIEPTEAGRIYFEQVEPLLEELRRAELSATDATKTPRGTLRITAPSSFAECNITPLLPEFSSRFPQITLDLRYSDTYVDLITEHIDVAIRIGALADSSLIAHKLCPMESFLCASPEYLSRHGIPTTPAELQKHATLLLSLPSQPKRQWRFTDARGRAHDIALTPVLSSSNALSIKQCALGGMGIALLAKWLAGRELRAGALVPLLTDYRIATTTPAAAWAMYPSRQYTPQKIKVFVDFLKEKFAGGAPWEQA